MFVDISGFTRMTDILMQHGKEGTEVLSELLKYLFEPTVQAIYAQGGFITTYAGDAFTALFPSTDNQPETAQRALQAAQEIYQFFTESDAYPSRLGEFEFGAKIGLGFGEVDWGIIGIDDKKTYYFRGPAIDQCAQAEHYAEKGEIWGERKFLALIANLLFTPMRDESDFSPIGVTRDFSAPPVDIVLSEISEEVVVKFVGKKEFHFPEGEFREVIAVFISFEGVLDLEEFMQSIFRLQEQYGGSRPQLDFGDKGGVVLLFFGAPVAYENKETRALQFISDLRAALLPPIQMRAGIAKGILYAGFYGAELQQAFSCLGSTTNQAARFMIKAEWGKILTDEGLARNPRFQFNHLGDFAYKGRLHKIPTYELVDAAIMEQRSVYTGTFHPSLSNRDLNFLVGRQKELEFLESLLEPIREGKFGGIVYIDGEAGLGKSRLVQELKLRVFTGLGPGQSGRFKWFYLPCDEVLQKSLNPVTHFLNEYFHQNGAKTPEEKQHNFEARFNNLFQKTRDPATKRELKRVHSVLGAMVNLYWEGSLFSQLDAKGRHENSLNAVKTLIKAESSQQPIIIELEDGHWIDADTRNFLQILTRNVEENPFIILSACRYHDDGTPVNFDLENIPQERVQLGQIERDSVKYMVAPLLSKGKGLQPVPEPSLDFIYQRSEGNPFFIEQISLYLQENDLLDERLNLIFSSSGADPGFQIPSTINDVLVARIDRLALELKEIVKTASVLGQEFATAILSAMLLKTSPASYEALSQHLAAGEKETIWEALSEIRYIFKHALIREAVYEMQLKKQLRALHQLAAESIEELYQVNLAPYYFDLAAHYEKAQIPEKAIRYLKLTGEAAQDAYQNQDAIRIYERLLGYLLPIEERIQILEKKGLVLQTIGDWEQAVDTFRIMLNQAESLGKPAWIAKAANHLGWLVAVRGNPDEALALSQTAYQICSENGDRHGLVRALKNRATVQKMLGQREEARQTYTEMLSLAEKIGDLKSIVSALFQLREYLLTEGNLIETFEKYLGIAEENGDLREMSRLLFFMGDVHLLTHNYAEAEKCNHRMYEIVRETGEKQGMCYAIGDRGIIYSEQGRFDEAIDCYQEKLILAEELGDGYNIWEGNHNMSSAYTQIKAYDQAEANLQKAIEVARKQALKGELCLSLLAKVDLFLAQNRIDQTRLTHAEAAQLAGQIGDADLVFSSDLQAIQIDFASGDAQAPERLTNLLTDNLETDKQANIFYELWKMTGEPQHQQQALEHYQRLYDRSKRYSDKVRLDELTQER